MVDNLDSMSLEHLKELKGRVDRALSSFVDRKRKAARAAIEEQARSLGFSLSELVDAPVGRSAGRARKTGEPKYANPANPAQTWTGRGRKPGWVVDALKAGKSIDSLAIK